MFGIKLDLTFILVCIIVWDMEIFYQGLIIFEVLLWSWDRKWDHKKQKPNITVE